MPSFLLIHGASHGAWCWTALIDALSARGHTARAIDLPGHGANSTDPATVTLADYVDAVVDAARPGDVLVGHSLGGLSTALAADPARGADLSAHVYLAAWVPRPGQALLDYRHDGASRALSHLNRRSDDGRLALPDLDAAPGVFFSGCPPEAIAMALPRLGPQPMGPMADICPIYAPHPNRHYIRCLNDLALTPDYQRRATADWPVERVHDLDAGHAPFFECPARLADVLDRIADI